jgi:hypothetical protein
MRHAWKVRKRGQATVSISVRCFAMARQDTRLNASQQRARIDRGEQGDKVPGFDPAAAPLGTDAEAAGTPTPEVALPPPGDARPQPGFAPAPEDSIAPDASPSKPRVAVGWPAAVVAAVAAVALACFYAFSRGVQG